MISRRSFNTLSLAASAGLVIPARALATAEPKVGDGGLHEQPWFENSFLNLKEDLEDAAGAGKRFAVIWEQKGCPYCREMHVVNFAKPEISDYIKKNFAVLQLNMWGSRKVTDFDGKEMEEKELARRWRVNFTPTICFFPEKAGDAASGRELEVMRMPGYFKPFHFVSMFEYVRQNAYASENFQRYIQAKFKKLEAEGKKPDLW